MKDSPRDSKAGRLFELIAYCGFAVLLLIAAFDVNALVMRAVWSASFVAFAISSVLYGGIRVKGTNIHRKSNPISFWLSVLAYLVLALLAIAI